MNHLLLLSAWLKEYQTVQTQAWQTYFNWLAMWGIK
jgi:hypothetical protein